MQEVKRDPAHKENMRRRIIYLAGFMGSGKTTIGPKLASRLDFDFVDIDNLMEEHEGISIPKIFEKFGERYFRNLEKDTLVEISKRERDMVVALGGGTLTMKENRNLIHKGGILVYLKTEPLDILSRVSGKEDRPMLLAGDGSRMSQEELEVRITSLLKEREKHYLEANIVVNTSNVNIEKSVEEIISKLSAESFRIGEVL